MEKYFTAYYNNNTWNRVYWSYHIMLDKEKDLIKEKFKMTSEKFDFCFISLYCIVNAKCQGTCYFAFTKL